MAETEYWKLLKDPRWQKKRLEVMQRAGFQCEVCGDKQFEQHAHHTYYEPGKAPWEYPTESLKCLCKPCHDETTERTRAVKKLIGQVDQFDMLKVEWFLRAMIADRQSQEKIAVNADCVDRSIALDGIAAYFEIGEMCFLNYFGDDKELPVAALRDLRREVASLLHSRVMEATSAE